MFSKVTVLGDTKHPLYKFLTSSTGGGEVRWNFEKFLVGKDGHVLNRFGSSTAPADSSIETAIQQALVR
jgi:glutathione peroxidase